MTDQNFLEETFNFSSTIYGPVKSWRFGQSLGIDPIFKDSTCSFNCTYCQLGNIQNITSEIIEYVSTKKVLDDYKDFLNKKIDHDIITYSGSGEPTLAKNLDAMIKGIRLLSPDTTQNILTNATTLNHESVREAICLLDIATIKLDVTDNETLQKVNRPDPSVNLNSIIEGSKKLSTEFNGKLEIQTMLYRKDQIDLNKYAEIINEINPFLVQLNTPKRPYPLDWNRENRGNHKGIFRCKTSTLKTISEDEATQVCDFLKKNTNAKIISVYN